MSGSPHEGTCNIDVYRLVHVATDSVVSLTLKGEEASPLLAPAVLLDRLGVRWLESFFYVLIAIMSIAFGAMFYMADIPRWEVAKGLIVPSLGPGTIPIATGLIGAVIMPHNLFLHSVRVLDALSLRKRGVGYCVAPCFESCRTAMHGFAVAEPEMVVQLLLVKSLRV